MNTVLEWNMFVCRGLTVLSNSICLMNIRSDHGSVCVESRAMMVVCEWVGGGQRAKQQQVFVSQEDHNLGENRL